MSRKYRSWNCSRKSCRRLDSCACTVNSLPAPEEVVLRDLRLGDEVLDRREAGADLEGAGRALGDLDVDLHHVVGRTAARGDVDLLEVSQGVHAPLRIVERRLAVGLALDDAQLAPDDLVAGLGVAVDVDPLEVDQLSLLNLEGHVDGAGLLVDRGRGRGVDVGVAPILVEIGQLLQILAELRPVENLAGLDRDPRQEILAGLQQIPPDVHLAQAVLRALRRS